MRVLLAWLLVVGVSGCGSDPDKKANELFVRAVQQIESAEDKTGDAAIAEYEQALENVQQIIDDYSDSDLAVRLVSGETLFTGQTLAEFQARVEKLKVPVATEAEKKAAARENARKSAATKRDADAKRAAAERKAADEKRAAAKKLLSSGKVCLQRGEYTDAIDLFNQAIRTDPTAEAFRLRDLAYHMKEKEATPALRVSVPTTNSIGMKLRLIPAGEFIMGSPVAEKNRNEDETQHQVLITKPFHLGVYEVTQAEYESVMDSNPSSFKGAGRPVENVNWEDAVEFCRKLSALPDEKEAGHQYRLPTEAEWEYACRAGTTTPYWFGYDETQLAAHGWFDENAGIGTHPVGGKKANAWDLYDMHGNVWEWCHDAAGPYPSSKVTDPTGSTVVLGANRVIRGGSWEGDAIRCRSAYRDSESPVNRYPYLGFRILRSSIKSSRR